MNIRDKQELVKLLHVYMDDLIGQNLANIQEANRMVKNGKSKWEGTYKEGVKAQYEHARIIATKLSVEIGKEIKSYWEL